jgi:hypothetical protein
LHSWLRDVICKITKYKPYRCSIKISSQFIFYNLLNANKAHFQAVFKYMNIWIHILIPIPVVKHKKQTMKNRHENFTLTTPEVTKLNCFGCLEVSIHATIWNMYTYKARNFPWWLVQTSFLEIWAFILKCKVRIEVWFSVSIFRSCVFAVKISFSLICVCLSANDKHKEAYSKTQSLKKRQSRTCVLCVCWCTYSAFWWAKNAISTHCSICL